VQHADHTQKKNDGGQYFVGALCLSRGLGRRVLKGPAHLRRALNGSIGVRRRFRSSRALVDLGRTLFFEARIPLRATRLRALSFPEAAGVVTDRAASMIPASLTSRKSQP